MMNTVVPVSLANRTSRAADSRTCTADPGDDSDASVCMVWIESTTSTRAWAAAASSRIASTRVCAARRNVVDSRPSRRERRATWRTDSSPEQYSTERSRLNASAAWSSSVDLPMPGSPPSRITEPATSPPPSTRSSSALPLEARVSVSSVTSITVLLVVAAGPLRPGSADTAGPETASRVFQASQSAHWPCHCVVLAPQAPQT